MAVVVRKTARPKVIIPRKELAQFCKRWKIAELSFFGSVLRNDFRPDSDIDLLVSFSPEARWGLFDVIKMERELREIFGRDVDLVERKAVERSENYIRRKHILEHTKIIYAAR